MEFPAFSFATAAEIRFGRGAAAAAVPDLAAFGERLFLVTGSSAERGAWMVSALEDLGREVVGFQVPREPDISLIEEGIFAARAAGAEAVIALGGGAAIDAAKAIAALVPASRPIRDHLEVVGLGLPLEERPLPFAAIPTTAGTDSEVTRNAVISVPDAGRKVSLRDISMLPRLAIVDPVLTESCPRDVTLASGLDAITQVIEPYLSTRANPMTDALCRAAIPVGLSSLARLMTAEDPAARDAMAWVSLCGGIALANAGLGVVHGLAGPLGGLSGAAHGAICGALLPHALAMNHARAQTDPLLERFEEVQGWIAAALGGTRKGAYARLASWARAEGLPGLDALAVDTGARKQAAQAAGGSSSMKANPAELSLADLEEILDQAG